MKRRTAIKGIVLFSLGTGIIHSCNDKYEAIRNLGLKYFTPNNKELDLLEQLVKVIVPFHKIPDLANHTPLPYLFTMLDDIYKKEDRNNFLFGYQNLNNVLQEKLGKKFHKLSEEETDHMMAELNEGKGDWDEKILSFYNILKGESINYLRTSEYYQRKINYYEMAPGRYNGDVLISELKNRNEI